MCTAQHTQIGHLPCSPHNRKLVLVPVLVPLLVLELAEHRKDQDRMRDHKYQGTHPQSSYKPLALESSLLPTFGAS